MFRTVPLPSSGVFHCTHSNCICQTCLLTACEQDQDQDPDPARKISEISAASWFHYNAIKIFSCIEDGATGSP